MTAPLRNTQHASNIAAITASQNTAPVAEFRCLFTQDIRRKQKRWQDGYLKFHTFNSRVMVYDQARNFLGDAYHKDSNELQEGDELTLNNGALVEVAEAIGITHTDLTQLFEKKTREAPPPGTAASQTKPFQKPSSVAPTNAQRNESQLRHKSLNTLLGTPKGPIGKAQPMKSPYEARKEKEKENEQVEERAPKRQKIAQPPANWRASSPAQEESPIAKKDPPLWARAADAKNVRRPAKFVPPAAATVITLDSESDPHPAFLSDVTLPSTPPKIARARAEARARSTPPPKPVVSERLPVQTPKIPQGKVPVPSVKALETPKQAAPASSPPVSVSNRVTNVDFAVQPSRTPTKEPAPPPIPPPEPSRKAKSLRLSTGVKRGKLLCQSLPQEPSRAGSEPKAAGTKGRLRQESRITSKEPSPALAQTDGLHTRDDDSPVTNQTATSRGKRKGTTGEDNVPPKRVRVSKALSIPTPSVFDDPEAMHGLMDQQLLVPSSPIRPQEVSPPPVVKAAKPKPVATKKTASRKPIAPLAPEVPHEEAVAQSRPPSPKVTTRKAQPRKKVVEKPAVAPASKVSLPLAPVLQPPTLQSRGVSPAHTEASDAQSRASSTSPRKAPVSTGGFLKRLDKPKRKQKQTTTTPPAPVVPAAAPRNETVPLPPHPLRANKKGPLMSTTELAALLQKPKVLKKALADPIEDEGTGASVGKSPNRAFRRVRSENDAPIPSAAEDWEKRNLPKTSGNLTDIVDERSIVTTAQEKPKKMLGGLAAIIKKTDPRRFKRTSSLQVDTNVPSAAAEEVELPSPVVDKDVGPWSTEAGDLFDWRPPGRGK
jgi:hypothetical protein